MQADCPPWCAGHPDYLGPEGDHSGSPADVPLSLVPGIEDQFYTGPDWLGVSVWSIAHEHDGAPSVAIMHGRDDSYLPQLAPAEAEALAIALLRKARDARHGTGTEAGTPLPAEGCPPWCGYQDAPNGCDGVHVSAGHPVAVTEHAYCSYERARAAGLTGLPCDEENCSELVNGDDGHPVVAVHHGDDFLPYMTLDAAGQFALDILGLIAEARAPQPAPAQGGAQ
jgi:hypothetical protein